MLMLDRATVVVCVHADVFVCQNGLCSMLCDGMRMRIAGTEVSYGWLAVACSAVRDENFRIGGTW